MKLTAHPFDATTGTLMPVYRDAYLRGDLSGPSARAVENYLRQDADHAHSTVTRWQEMTTEDGVAAVPTSWVQTQMRFIREQPQRFRRRALTMVSGAVLVAGMAMAGTQLPAHHHLGNLPGNVTALTTLEDAVGAGESASRMVTLRGRILSDGGEPLVGATVLRKGTSLGVSTDANGEYSLRLPAAEAATATLQYGYAGYADREVKASEVAQQGVTLQPQATKRRHWLFF